MTDIEQVSNRLPLVTVEIVIASRVDVTVGGLNILAIPNEKLDPLASEVENIPEAETVLAVLEATPPTQVITWLMFDEILAQVIDVFVGNDCLAMS